MPEITVEELRKWNALIKFSKEKGYAGKPELDHDIALRKKVFDEFNKANPNDALPYDIVKPIQAEIQAYRAKALERIKSGGGGFAPGVNENNFMASLSKVDGLFGQLTSSWQFPSAYLTEKGQTKNLGFANKVDLTQYKP